MKSFMRHQFIYLDPLPIPSRRPDLPTDYHENIESDEPPREALSALAESAEQEAFKNLLANQSIETWMLELDLKPTIEAFTSKIVLDFQRAAQDYIQTKNPEKINDIAYNQQVFFRSLARLGIIKEVNDVYIKLTPLSPIRVPKTNEDGITTISREIPHIVHHVIDITMNNGASFKVSNFDIPLYN